MRLGLGRYHVGPGPSVDHPHIDGGANCVVVERVQRQDLLRELLRRADAFLWLHSRVGRATGGADEVVARAFSTPLWPAARPRPLPHQGPPTAPPRRLAD